MPQSESSGDVPMIDRIILLTAGVGVSTYLMRLIPLVVTVRQMSGKKRITRRLGGFLGAIGPSFVTVFLVHSILPSTRGEADTVQVALKVAALLPVALMYGKTKNFGISVFTGLVAYGCLFYFVPG